MDDQKGISIATIGFLSILGILLIVGIFESFYTVSAGERGVILTFGKPNMQSQGEGLHFKVPIIQHVIIMDVKTQKYVVEKASAASKDLQTVTTDVTINYVLNPEEVPNIYTTIGKTYQDKVITPAVLEIVKAATAQYTAEELITKRPEVKEKIDTALRERLRQFGITVQAVSITNFDFSPSFNAAIEAKVTAEQNALAAKNKLEQVKYEAQQRIEQSQGEAKAIEIQASAIKSQGGSEYVQLQAINRWNGMMPQVVTSGGALPFINIPIGNNSI
jgi:regulator of protease activity HflC (stomatin/prohibitin superfamily)